MRNPDESLWLEGLEIVRRLVQRGHSAYLVGGCVRDRLMNRRLHDIDIATSARPEQVIELFERTVPTGLKHGTVTVIHNGRSFEVTTYRRESGYSDARRPDEVSFVSDIREDLSRRDFTINAMAAALDGEFVDPFGGKTDLEARMIRCVGAASERFGEDALRMLRAIRFGAEFRFQLSEEVWEGILSQAPRLKQVAMERVGAEWDRMMAGSGPDLACRLLFESGLLEHFKETPPASLLAAAQRYRLNPVTALPAVAEIEDTDLRWTAFLIENGLSDEEIAGFCKMLRFSGRRISRICAAAKFNERLCSGNRDRTSALDCKGFRFTREEWTSAVLEFGVAAAQDWLAIRTRKCGQESEAARWLSEMTLTSVSQLAVKGDELSRRLKKAPGPWVALLLRQLAEQAALGDLANDKQALLEAAEAIIDK